MNYGVSAVIVGDIAKSKPPHTEEDARAMLDNLGEMTMANSEVRKRLQGNEYELLVIVF